MKTTPSGLSYLLGVILTLAGYASVAAEAPETIVVRSEAFEHNTDIPLQFSAYGTNVSPDISWSNLPAGTRQLALILDDPVFGMPPFVHWVAYNIPVTANGLPQGLSPDAIVTHPGLEGMINGNNGTRRSGYFGPRPPNDGKVHTYNFRIYALDYALNLPDGLNKDGLLEAMDGHILATGLLTGNFKLGCETFGEAYDFAC
ncbi:MAG: YbhB/YbcL family Raf kinase inhibitor-like protein [Pseudohongiellaceae bacterium]